MHKDKIKTMLLILLGTTLTAVGLSMFLTPNKIVCGGVSGIATVLYHTSGIPTGLTIAILNLLLLVIGFKVLGKSFILKTIIGSGLLSILVQLTSYLPTATNDVFIATVFGGLLYGVGIGIALAAGASTGGTDILGRLVQHVMPHLPIGKLLMAVDGIVIVVSLIAFREINLVFYGIVTLFVESMSIDYLIRYLNISKMVYVISERGTEIAQNLVSVSPRGVTIIHGVGGYTMEKRDVLMCAMKANEIEHFQKTVKTMDSDAFVVYGEAQKIVGNGFKVYH